MRILIVPTERKIKPIYSIIHHRQCERSRRKLSPTFFRIPKISPIHIKLFALDELISNFRSVFNRPINRKPFRPTMHECNANKIVFRMYSFGMGLTKIQLVHSFRWFHRLGGWWWRRLFALNLLNLLFVLLKIRYYFSE